MKKYTFLVSIILIISNLSAHCDGCGTETKHAHGTLKGNIKFDSRGITLKIPTLNKSLGGDAYCGAQHEGKVYSERLIVDEDSNLKNVLVWLKNVKYNGPIPSEPAVLDQKGCIYTPHVLGVVKNQKVIIKNSDAIMHNVHSMPEKNTSFNIAMPAVIKEKETSFTVSEEPFYIKCDVHPWMMSWVLVQDHPYFAVTDAKGNFTIENIPPGTYEVVAWQERFKMKGAITKTIEIKDSAETIQDFVFVMPQKKK